MFKTILVVLLIAFASMFVACATTAANGPAVEAVEAYDCDCCADYAEEAAE